MTKSQTQFQLVTNSKLIPNQKQREGVSRPPNSKTPRQLEYVFSI